jgi:hypothetical protein
MSDPEPDPQLQFTAHRVAELSRRVDVDLQHMARLREELLRRHQELSAERTQRAAGRLWFPVPGLKRLTLVAPTALAVVAALGLALAGLQISGHRPAQTAEAARLAQALAQTAPTVTAWQWTLHQVRGNAPATYGCSLYFNANQRLYVWPSDGYRVYLYSSARWYQVTAPTHGSGCQSNWQWAFVLLPADLEGAKPAITPWKPVAGEPSERIVYTRSSSTGVRVRVTAIVGRDSGLVRHLERLTLRGGRVLERDSADYRYERTQ